MLDFSNQSVFEQVLDLTIADGKPLVVGTSELSESQIKILLDATKIIPIFRDDQSLDCDDVLKITKIMTIKPVMPGKFYNLDILQNGSTS